MAKHQFEEMMLTAPELDAPAKEDTSQQWHLHLQQAQGSREYIYQFDQNGEFLSVREGQRKLVAFKDTKYTIGESLCGTSHDSTN